MITRFDEKAGHLTQQEKAAMMITNCKDVLGRIRDLEFDGHKPKCGNVLTLVGETIACSLARVVAPVDERVCRAILVAKKISNISCNISKTARVATAAVIPTATYGTTWVKATSRVQGRLKAQMLNLTWGKNKRMRCTEVVVAVLNCPTKVDPTYASALRTFTTANRMLRRGQEREATFHHNMEHVIRGGMPKHAVGPSAGICQAAEVLDATVDTSKGEVWITTPLGAKFRLSDPNNTLIAQAVRDAARHATLKSLAARASEKKRQRTDGSLAYGRADMHGITDWVDMQATRKLLDARTSKAGGIGWAKVDDNGQSTYRLNRQGKALLRQIISGSIRPPHRLQYLGIGVDDKCSYCAQPRCDAEHLFWHCPVMSAQRSEATDAIQRIAKGAMGQSIWRGNKLQNVLGNNAFRNCGICPGEGTYNQCHG